MAQLNKLNLDYGDIRTTNYIDEIEKKRHFIQNISHTPSRNLNFYYSINLSSYTILGREGYISRVNLRPEVKKNKIIEFIKKQKNIALENEKDFIDCLNDLSLGQHEYLYEFFINLEKFLKKNERKARIYVHNDQICIYIVFRDSESTSDIDATINEAYNLLRKEISAFINIGEDFEG